MHTIPNSLVVIISILISVAFYTMLERKILSYIQTRKGPNKVGLMGILQPFSDALKLFNKTLIIPLNSNYLFFLVIPLMGFFLSLLIWPCLPMAHFNILDSSLNSLILILISSATVYTTMMLGWSSNSKYSHLGSIRSVAQMVSYEINFFMIILFFMLMNHTYNLQQLPLIQSLIPLLIGLLPLFTLWMISCIAEVNRSPFDFAESESELVSGFNTEYMGSPFAFIFLSEYTNMLILSILTTLLFLGLILTLLPLLTAITISIILIWARGTLPRLRYDMLMHTNWKHFLPYSTITFIVLFIFISALF